MTLLVIVLMIVPGSAFQQELPPTVEELAAAYEYLFSPEQQEEFDSLESESQRTAVWNRYWRSVDPSKDTEFNELQELFRRRLNDTLFFAELGAMPRAWEGDRGRVYLLFGAPAAIYRGYKTVEPPDRVFQEVWVYELQTGEGIERSEITFDGEDQNGALQLNQPIDFPRQLSLLPRLPGQEQE